MRLIVLPDGRVLMAPGKPMSEDAVRDLAAGLRTPEKIMVLGEPLDLVDLRQEVVDPWASLRERDLARLIQVACMELDAGLQLRPDWPTGADPWEAIAKAVLEDLRSERSTL